MKEIYPTKVYVVDVFDQYGTFEQRLKDPYPSTSYSYYDSIKDAQDDINWRKKNRPHQFDKGFKFKIHPIPFDEAHPGAYGYPHGGKRYNKEQVAKIMKEQEEEAYWSDDGSYSGPRVTDEIEGRDYDHIFMKAFYGAKHQNKNITDREAYDIAHQAVKEYVDGIKDRKKKSAKPKPKRIKKTIFETVLPTTSKIKSMKDKAEAKIKSVYSPVKLNLRKKKPKKVVSKRKTKSGKK